MASIAPVFAPDVQDIMRRRQMAEALIQRGMSTPEGTQYAGGAAVKNSPLVGIGNLLLAGVGAYKKNKADKEYKNALASALMSNSQEEPTPSPQVSNVPQGTSAQPAYDPYSDPMNPTGAPAPQMPSQAAPQVSNAPQQGMSQNVPQSPPMGNDDELSRILRMQQFPELKGIADLAMKQYEAKQKFAQDQQAAELAFKRSREGHQQDRTFDIQNPEDKSAPRPYWMNPDGSIDPMKYRAAVNLASASANVSAAQPKPDQIVQTDQGTMLIDPRTGAMKPLAGPNGEPITKSQPITEFQGKQAQFASRAEEANKNYESAHTNPSIGARHAEELPFGVGNLMIGDKTQQALQAEKEFIQTAVLRADSGAAISKSEYDQYGKVFFPRPGDSPEVIKQKAAARQSAIDGLKGSAGPAALKAMGLNIAKPQTDVIRKKYNPATGKIE